jgi:RNA polymerase sigma factor (sigma-70 family)
MIKPLKVSKKKNREREIYDAFAENMMLLCFRYLGNVLDAEEAMHNGFIKVFSNLKKFKPVQENSFGAWVKKIMINECLMFLRKKVNFKLVSLDEVNEIKDNCFENHNAANIESYLALINQLPIGYKTIFNLYAIEGYSHKEIGLMLKITESTSRSQLTKARKLLQQKLVRKEDLYA